jgi:citrate lyase beta subunit
LGPQGAAGILPVCDHYSGVKARMVKSLQLQAEMIGEFGVCGFDVTRDCEDGAPIGGEKNQVNRALALANVAQAAIVLIVIGVRRRARGWACAVDAAMAVCPAPDYCTFDKFHHTLVFRAKMGISSACHADGKDPSRCVVAAIRDTLSRQHELQTPSSVWGSARMWSIPLDQIRPIVEAISPSRAELDLAIEIVLRAYAHDRAPLSVGGQLHDHASYRYFWQILERAHQTGVVLPPEATLHFSSSIH